MEGSIRKYLAFIKTVEYGSFTKAAQALHYSQSGVSRMIHDLEQEWGLRLLERSRAGLHLTSEGARILPCAKSLCGAFHSLQNCLDDMRNLQGGVIRIGTFSSVATHWLPNIIRAFQNDYPGMDYELLLGDYGEIEEWIVQGRVDCGFLRLPLKADLETLPLERDRLLAVLPEGHRLAACERVPIAALCEEPFMLLEKGGKAEISELFARNGLEPRVRFTTWDDYAVMSMVESGLGLSILPELILRRIPYRLVCRELDVPAYRDIALALRERESAPRAVRRFLEYLDYRHIPA